MVREYTLDERLLLNAAINKVVEKKDESGESIALIIALGNLLETSPPLSIQGYLKSPFSKDPPMLGHTEHGQVNMNEEENTPVKINVGEPKLERAGNWKIWKTCPGVLTITEFWASGPTTRASHDEPLEYWVCYDPATLRMIYVAEVLVDYPFSITFGKIFLGIMRKRPQAIYGIAPRTAVFGISYTRKR